MNRETKDSVQAAAGSKRYTCGTVHQANGCALEEMSIKYRALGPIQRATNFLRGTGARGGGVYADEKIGIENGEQTFDVSGAEGGEKGVN